MENKILDINKRRALITDLENFSENKENSAQENIAKYMSSKTEEEADYIAVYSTLTSIGTESVYWIIVIHALLTGVDKDLMEYTDHLYLSLSSKDIRSLVSASRAIKDNSEKKKNKNSFS